MPALNKQTLINLLIDSPLREPIKINLIDIVNNTNDVDLPKTYSTISKELEIFQKATERRMKLADETIAKLKDGGSVSSADSPALPPLPPLPPMPEAPTAPTLTPPPAPASLPPLDLPPLPTADAGLKVPPLDLPPMPTMSAPTPAATPAPDMPTAEPTPAPAAPVASTADEDALKEIQKELDALKASATEDVAPAPAPQA